MNASTVFHCKKKVALVIAFVSHRASDLVQFQFMEVFGMGKELSEMTLEAGDV